MKYPFTKIEFKQYCNVNDKSIINKYWEIERGEFKYRPTDLANELETNNQQLSKLVKSNSICSLHIENCLVCLNDIIIKVTSQTNARNLLENRKYNCDTCRAELTSKLKGADDLERKEHRMNYAVEYKFWNRIEKDEFDILKKIIEYDNYFEFKKKYLNQNFDFVWHIIEKLDNIGLIDIRGEGETNRPIKQLYFLPELREKLKINTRENTHTESSLTFHIPKHQNRTKNSQPKFFKRVVFDKDIILRQGTEYYCSVWENDDGSVNLGIKAKSELPDRNVDDFNDEPKLIGDLISKMRE